MTIQEYIKQKEEEVEKISTVRLHEKTTNRQSDLRDSADIDYARVLYSSAFRRLQGKMQLFVPKNLNFIRNRLTHSLEVAQIARGLAKELGLKDILTVQTCSLVHDLGNPPFGHAGELYLSNCSRTSDYEGNAQSLRVITHLEEKHHGYNGLNLTLRTILGVVKYPYSKRVNQKKYLYDDDFKLIEEQSEKYGISLKTIDCEIMDIADEIAYAAHDLEDALRKKYFSIGDLLYEFKSSKFSSEYENFSNIVRQARDFAIEARTYHTSEEYSILFKKELTSLIVHTLMKTVELVPDKGTGKFKLGYKNNSELALGLKKLTFEAIKRNPEIKEYELMGEKVLTGLFQVYMDKKFNRNLELLPAEYRQPNNWERTVLDYIGGMMDEFAINQYKKYYGNSSLDGVYK